MVLFSKTLSRDFVFRFFRPLTRPSWTGESRDSTLTRPPWTSECRNSRLTRPPLKRNGGQFLISKKLPSVPPSPPKDKRRAIFFALRFSFGGERETEGNFLEIKNCPPFLFWEREKNGGQFFRNQKLPSVSLLGEREKRRAIFFALRFSFGGERETEGNF